MAYSELIKNFEKIRGYMREFYVYGFKSREEYDGKSSRSYDNEKRRIESWLGEYMNFRQDSGGKTVFLSVDEHLHGTAQLCSHFASSFGEDKRGLLLGYAHDIGKTSYEFQKRLQGGAKVDHSSAGAYELAKMNELPAACCVAGHHGGLPNYGSNADTEGTPTLIGRVKKAMLNKIPQ